MKSPSDSVASVRAGLTSRAGGEQQSALEQAAGRLGKKIINDGVRKEAVKPVSTSKTEVNLKILGMDSAPSISSRAMKNSAASRGSRISGQSRNNPTAGVNQNMASKDSQRLGTNSARSTGVDQTVAVKSVEFDFSKAATRQKFADAVGLKFNELSDLIRQGKKDSSRVLKLKKLIDPTSTDPMAIKFHKHCQSNLPAGVEYSKVAKDALAQLECVLEIKGNNTPLVILEKLQSVMDGNDVEGRDDLLVHDLRRGYQHLAKYTMSDAKKDVGDQISSLKAFVKEKVKNGQLLSAHAKHIPTNMGCKDNGTISLEALEIAGQLKVTINDNMKLTEKEYKDLIRSSAIRLFAEYLVDPGRVAKPGKAMTHMPDHRAALLNKRTVLTNAAVGLSFNKSANEWALLHVQRYWLNSSSDSGGSSSVLPNTVEELAISQGRGIVEHPFTKLFESMNDKT